MAAIDYVDVAQEMDALGVGAQDDVRAFLAGAANPWDAYISVPIGSRYFKSDGTWYWKSGAGDTSGDWTEIVGTGATPETPLYEDPHFWMLRGS